jgi:hypothetical protein
MELTFPAAAVAAIAERVQAEIGKSSMPSRISTPPAPPSPKTEVSEPERSVVERMKQLAELRDLGLISAEEYETKRTELLREV